MIKRIKKKLLQFAYSEVLSGRLASRLLALKRIFSDVGDGFPDVTASETSGVDDEIYVYQNVLVFSPYGLSFDRNGRVIQHNLGGNDFKILRRTIRELGILRFFWIYLRHIHDVLPVSIQEACHLVPRHGYRPNAPNYCHWLLEDLPKLSRYSRVMTSVNVLVNSAPTTFQEASLKYLGVVEKIFKLNPQFDLVDSLYFCRMFSAGSKDGETDRQGRLWVRDKLLAEISPDPIIHRSVYVVRSDGVRRTLENDAEVAQFFKNRDFELVNPDSLAFIEQVKLFSQTYSLAAVHGAALANMIFMKVGKVYELSHVHISDRIFFRILAQDIGLTYVCSCSNGATEITIQGNDLVSFNADLSDIECGIDGTNIRYE